MRAIVLQDKEQSLQVQEVETPKPAAGEVLVRIKAAAFNHRDLWIQKGQYAGLRYPIILGSDGAGVVTEVGDGANEHWLDKEVIINPGLHWGDDPNFHSKQFKILGLPDNGTFAEYVVVPASALFNKPAYLSWEEAAAIPLAGLTAYRALFTRGKVKQGNKVLISGIGGGVALMAMKLALAAGAEVYVTSGSDDKIDRAVQLGAKLGINYKINGWHKLFQSAVEGFDVIIDSAAGDGFKNFVDLANLGGRIVFYGGTQGPITSLNPQKIFWKHLNIMGTTMGTPAEFEEMVKLFETHQIHPVIDKIFPMADAEVAIRKMDEASQFGKLVLQGF
ncbi:zinc-binding dehydrogenase [Aridibaculum aurantiacum]|uniref:zinc-binding dehydrogenase n=1 Tax=Aridibaculum aurantiacum TaxID=2810307 RepID=UPI001A97544A|nr:zinc-binding dehydrogenase [Aridibaculum aurantiacum]